MLVVIATKDEINLVKELKYDRFPILITGVGGMNVINALKDIPKDTEILNIGYAGSNKLDIGTKVRVNSVRTYHPSVDFFECGTNNLTIGDYKCYTSTDFVTHCDIEEPCVFDMELAFICALGFKRVTSIKVVSDNLSLKQYEKNVVKP